jgi:hypothetical protein
MSVRAEALFWEMPCSSRLPSCEPVAVAWPFPGLIYLLVAATLSSSVGGYIARRLRTKWTGLHTHEVYFRDAAHGYLAWAFGTVIRLASASAYIAGGATAGLRLGGSAVGQAGRPKSELRNPLLTIGPGQATRLYPSRTV